MARQRLEGVSGEMGILSVISFAQQLVRSKVREGDTVVDATLGNGNDALFLAQLVGPRGRVYGFDVQEAAVEASRARLTREGVEARCTLLCESHALLHGMVDSSVHGKVAAVMFNLGYLPGSDESVITLVDSTLAALQQALDVLRSDGVLSVLVYPGHTGGDTEAAAVEAWASGLPASTYQVMCYRSLNRHSSAPYGIFVSKK